jgi:hypothetical protein
LHRDLVCNLMTSEMGGPKTGFLDRLRISSGD